MRPTHAILSGPFILLMASLIIFEETLWAAEPTLTFVDWQDRASNDTSLRIGGKVAATSRALDEVNVIITEPGGQNWDGKRWCTKNRRAKKPCRGFRVPILSTDLSQLDRPEWFSFERVKEMPSGKNLPEGTYSVTARANDNLPPPYDKTITNYKQIRVLIDRTAPKIGITSPLWTPVEGRGQHHLPEDPYIMRVEAGTKYSFPASTGTAADTGPASSQSGLDRVEVHIVRQVDGLAWDRQRLTWTRTRGSPFCTARSASWSCSENLPRGEHLPSGKYTIYAHAYDKAGNVSKTFQNVLVQAREALDQGVPVPASQPPTGSPPARPAPPEGEVKAGAKPGEAYVIAMNPELKGRLGRLVVAFPEGFNAENTRTYVFKEQTEVAHFDGNKTMELLPGTYAVAITGKRVEGVTIQSGHDTKVKVGALRVNAGKDTRVYLLDSDKTRELAHGDGTQELGFPIGTVHVHIAGQTDTATIEDGKITDF